MQRIAKFEKVSLEQFTKDFLTVFPESGQDDAKGVYDRIKLPERATSGSAGYDFFAVYGFTLEPGKTMKVPTGIRVKMEEGWVLSLYPRSSFGFKFRMQLDNTVGIIDSDYYNADNEGHIWVKVTNDTKVSANEKVLPLRINSGGAFVQGIFLPFGITEDDDATAERKGGFGSTSAKLF